MILLAGFLAGCGSGLSSQPKASAITMTNGNGLTAPAAALSVGSNLLLQMAPSGDASNAGVDWTVICGGNSTTGSITNGACGTLTPAHTADGGSTIYTAPSTPPIGTAVTIRAAVTSNPAQASTANITILATPVTIAIAFTGTTPSSLQVNSTQLLTAKVTNDPIGNGVIWTAACGSGVCGSFNPTSSTGSPAGTTYTAPASVPNSGMVTITATSLTDTTKSASATITITGTPPPPPPPAPIAVAVLPANIYVQRSGAGRSASLTAVVSNDTALAGVDWSVSCGTSSCGTISSHTASGAAATFQNSSTVAVGGTITVTAKSTGDPSKSATATATVVTSAPIAISLSTPLPQKLNTDSQTTLAATVSSGSDGVNWTATCGSASACGSFNLSPAQTASGGQIIYTAPAAVPDGNVVTITASSAGTAASNSAFTTTTIVQAPPPPPGLSFVTAPPASLVGATQLALAVAIANDVAPGGVKWTVAPCGSNVPGGCGWFSSVQTASGATTIYTAPPVSSTGTSVVLTATSIGDPSVSLNSNPITIAPDTTLAVNFIPSLPSQVAIGTTISLSAAVANDSTHAGVDWQVCSNGCGYFIIKPGVPAIDGTATTSPVPAQPPVTATNVKAWPSGLPIPYVAPPQVPDSGIVSIVASAHADTTKKNSGIITVNPNPVGPSLNGVVQAGTAPVVGASVALYSAGTNGYASASTQIAVALPADNNGVFTIPSGYTCLQPNSQMYLVATGGQVGKNDPNPNLVLMTALGSCGNLSSSSVVVNEVTTIAAAFATASFAANDALTGNSSYLYIGTSRSNTVGLANAFAAVNNLVDVSTGKTRFRVPAENADVPYVEINTLADILNACAASSGGVEGDGSPCSTLFTATDLLGDGHGGHSAYPGSVAPADTLQASFNIAQHPVSNYGYTLDNGPTYTGGRFFTSANQASPFQPILPAQPHDWSVSLNYISGGGLSSSSSVGSFAVDGSGNLWITDAKAGSVIEWNSTGAAVSPATGYPAGGGPLAIDASGNLWISGNGTLTELNSIGDPLPWSPFGGVNGGGTDAAFDALGNLWIANADGVHEFNNVGLQLSPVNGYTFNGLSNFNAIGVDSSNNVWATGASNQGPAGQFVEIANPGGQLIYSSGPAASTSQIAADAKGDVWYGGNAGIGGICENLPYAGKGSTTFSNCTAGGGPNGGGTSGLNFVAPGGIALDGAGTLWLGSAGGQGYTSTLVPGIFPLSPGLVSTPAQPYSSSSLAAGPLQVAIDGAGNVWVLLANNTVTEYIGAATPVVAPLALGVQTKKIGARP